jgi:AraC-like DNA-binding protein
MVFDFNLYSSLLLVFFVHILIYAIMFWRRGVAHERLSDKLLGSFLFLSALYVFPWMVGFAGWYWTGNAMYREILFYAPFVHGLFFGPLLFLYVKSITNFNFKLTRRDWLHFLPGLLYLAWTIVVVVVDKLILKRYYLMNGSSDPDFDAWYQLLQTISIISYLVISLRYYKQYRRFAFQELSFAETASMRWLRNFLIAFGILTLLPLVEYILEQIPSFRELEYKGTWYKFLCFAVVVYYVAINAFSAGLQPLHRIFFNMQQFLQQQQRPLQLAAQEVKEAEFEVVATSVTAGNNSQPDALKALKEKLVAHLEAKKAYLDPEITLSVLAKKIGTNASVLSKVVNDNMGQNFNDFINGYRVREVIVLLKAGEQKRQTLLGIAYDCGFNSKATFNRAFKKATELSPKEYIATLISGTNDMRAAS